MRAERPLRLPLQLGISALYSLARGSALAVPGLILFTIGLAIVIYIGDVLSGDAGGYIVVALLSPGFLTSAFAYKHLKRAHVERPSDLLVTKVGIQIRGGPHHGETVEWTAITAVRVDIPPKPKKDENKLDDSDLRVLTIECHARALRVASAERIAEQRSLDDLARTLRAASGHAEPPKDVTHAAPVNLVTCGSCGAALAPSDAATIVCPYCQHETAVTDEMRAMVRDARALEARPDAAISKLLDQPTAGFVGALYVVAAMFMLVAWPVAVMMMFFEYQAQTLTLAHAGFLFGFVLACIAGFYALIRGRLVDRQALRLVALDFAAIEPAKPGEPYRCKRCLAPLPDAGEDRVFVRCVYCNADNVLGLHIGREASIAREESASLDDALRHRLRERRRWRGVTLVALGLLVVAWFSLRHGIAH